MNRIYESMLILRPDLGDQEKEEIAGKITKKVEDLKGEVSSSQMWAKEKTFYYFLKGRGSEKKNYYKGCYWLINFALSQDKIPEIKEVIRLEERILRSIIFNIENKKVKAKSPK